MVAAGPGPVGPGRRGGAVESRAAAMRSPSGDRLLAYLPGPGAVAVDLGKLTAGGPAHATWIDPRGGDRADLGEFPATGRRRFATPGAGPTHSF